MSDIKKEKVTHQLNSMSTSTVSNQRSSKGLNVALWIVQVILAAAFGIAGLMKSTSPIPDLAAQLVWPGDIPVALVRIIGVSELLAAIGLLLPSILRIRPSLTVWAALGLVVVMALALIFHISRGEMQALPINLVFGLLAGFVAWGRSQKVIILPK
ncbi:DoxX-like family protein [Chitinophaga sp. YR573]|uniref:DoxX family protein n=1 Tax=Chitinophaga sp. YR573 TaxID=1881040 RepID=UPI0008CFEA97|nr:DoxX family protein [Chitinophaga sp. YR573]SEW39341.1 DoxX-like family protein [Chitinophaga sp. YR573]